MIDTIKRVAAFANPKDDINGMQTLEFRPGEVFAQSSVGGARAPIDLDLECSVNAFRLLKALKAIRGDPTFSMAKSLLEISSGKNKVSLSTSSVKTAAKFYCPPKKAVWKKTGLLEGVSRVSWCVSQDSSRAHLCGVWFGSKGLIATNGHALCMLGDTDFSELLKLNDGLLVPPQMLHGLDPEVWLTLDGDQRLFISADKDGADYRSCRLIAAKFPPVDQIVNNTRNYPTATVSRSAFIDCLKRAKISSGIVTLAVTAKHLGINVSDSQSSLFDFVDSIPLEDSAIKPFKTSANVDYLLPLVNSTVSDVITLHMGDAVDPIVVSDGDFLGLVMPFRQ